MEAEVIVTTPSQLKALVMEAVTQALEQHHQSLVETQPDPDRWMTIEELSEYLPGKPAKTTLYDKVRYESHLRVLKWGRQTDSRRRGFRMNRTYGY